MIFTMIFILKVWVAIAVGTTLVAVALWAWDVFCTLTDEYLNPSEGDE